MLKKTIKSETINTQHKKTKNFLIVLLGIGIFFILFGSFFSVYSKNKAAFQKSVKEKKENPEQIAVVNKQEIKESWASSVERRLKANQLVLKQGINATEKSFKEDAQRREARTNKKLEQIKNLIQVSQSTIENRIKKIDAKINDVERRDKDRFSKAKLELKELKRQSFTKQNRIMSSDSSKPFLPPLVTNEGSEKGQKSESSDSSNSNDSGKILLPKIINETNILPQKDKVLKTKVKSDKLSFFVDDEINTDIEKQYPLKTKDKEPEIKPTKKYELGLGFFDAINLTGAYAPLFGESASQASIPVLLEVNGDMIVANGFTESVDKCFVLGGAIGNPSSNTVDIRLSTIECILADGKHKIRGAIKGWVIGRSGKPGLQGELIHKSGQYISRFILAGLLQSLSSAFVSAATPSNTTGSATNVITGGAVQGAATGTGNAFNKLADFYIKLAEKTLPMIEAKAGVHCSVLIEGGTLYSVKKFNSININDLIIEYNKQTKGQ